MGASIDLLDALPEPYVLLQPVQDDAGHIVDFTFAAANPAACTFNGLPAEQLIGARLTSLHPNAVDSGIFGEYCRIVETGVPLVLTDWAYEQDLLGGETRYYDVRAIRAQGCVSQMWIDVTERHHAREALVESENRYRLLAENASDVVYLSDNDGVVVWISPSVKDLTGWSPEDLVGRPMPDLLHPDDIPTMLAGRDVVKRGGRASGQVRMRTADGQYRWLRVSAQTVTGDDGAVVGRVGSWTDIQDLVAARDQAELQRRQTQSILDNQLDPFTLFETVRDEAGEAVDLRIVLANTAGYAYNEMSAEEMNGRTFLELFPGLMEHGPMAAYLTCAVSGVPVVLDDYAYDNEILGEERRYDLRAVQCGDGIALTWRDVTERFRANQALAESEYRYRLLAENSSDVIWQVAADGRVEWASDSTADVLGWEPRDVLGRVALDYIIPEDQTAAAGARDQVVGGGEIRARYRVRRADAGYRWMEFTVRGIQTTTGVGRVVALRDIDAEVMARDRLIRIVGRDPLTGLRAREAMQETIAEAVTSAGAERVALVCVGLDSLSSVNEAFTHATGDVVLATTASRIVEQVGDPDNVGRGAGVDFLVLITDSGGVADVAALAERIRLAVRESIVVGAHTIEPTASLGVATGDLANEAGQLIRAATLAMRMAKDAGRDRLAFASPDLAVEAERRAILAGEVAAGLRADEFTCWFQPITDLMTGELQGYEALARWIRPDGTVVGPADFMPVVERTGMVVDVDEMAMRASLRVMADLPAHLFLSVNVSSRSLASAPYFAFLTEALHTSGIAAARLHLEVTETALFDVTDEVVERMRALANLGARWFVDDFGTGFSSISHLRDLPVAGLKLDLSFTAGIAQGDPQSIRLAQALAGLAQGLGLDTVAEGVETPEQAAILSAQGWRRGQGWLYGKAAPLMA